MYDLHRLVQIALDAERFVENALVRRHYREGGLHGGHLSLPRWGIDKCYLPDLAQIIEYVRNRSEDALCMELTAQEAAEHQGQDATENMDLDLLVCPMMLGPQADI